MVKIKIKKTINPAIEAEEGKRFWLQDGRVLKSVEELAEALEEMSQSVWEHHVTVQKNDFANWVEDVFGEKKIGLAIRASKDPKTAAKKAKARTKETKLLSFLYF